MKNCIVFVIFFVAIVALVPTTSCFCAQATSDKCFVISANNKDYCLKKIENTDRMIQNQYTTLNLNEKQKVARQMLKMGFDTETIINYLFPSIKLAVQEIEQKENIEPQNAKVKSGKNCKIEFINSKNGSIFNKNAFYNAFFEQFCDNNRFCAQFENTPAQIQISDIKPLFKKCSDFATNFASSGESRRNNIELATKSINGIVLKSGEEFSFNKATGQRTAEKGYKSAKIIVNGEYVDGFGGGVCQVSTTLYNSALLAGLDITEVHAHSLPSSYVEPGFDAMVNMGSSDLKFVNNSGGDIIITACANAGVCRVVIYGIKPQHLIKKRFEKYDTIKPAADKVKYEYSSDNTDDYEERITYGAEGYSVKSYIDYYSGDVLVKTEKVRDCKYNARQGLVIKHRKI